jgi:death-on-curing protein
VSELLAHLTVSAVRAIHAEVLKEHGGSPGIRDLTLLESAVAAPQATMMGQPLITDPIEIAGAYLFYICANHPFVDGNKRTALASALTFLAENNLLPEEVLPLNDCEDLVLNVAASRIDRAETTERLRKLVSAPRPKRRRNK